MDTPALLVDLDAVERNISRLQRHLDEQGIACRPHVKTHKSPEVARMQLDAGAVGITCQKLGEAEVMADAGLNDILISFPLVGVNKLSRLVGLARRARVTISGDSETVACGLSHELSGAGLECDFLVECDTGMGRVGAQTPRDAARLATLVDALPGLRFAGLMTYPTPDDGGAWLAAAREACERSSLDVRVVSGGGTPQAFQATKADGITEHRAGTYVYGDRHCLVSGSVALSDIALTVKATVVSRPTSRRAIIDTGSKALTSDPVAQVPDAVGHGLILEYPDATIYRLSEEHGHVDVSGGRASPSVGEMVTIIPNHACGAVNLYDEVTVTRGGEPVAVWPIAARGRSR
jgi:D-serine deaminase-like pyridoxal phosphate-dependent protein